MVYPESGPVHLDPTPSWVVALGDAPDYGWAATGARKRVMRPQTDGCAHQASAD